MFTTSIPPEEVQLYLSQKVTEKLTAYYHHMNLLFVFFLRLFSRFLVAQHIYRFTDVYSCLKQNLVRGLHAEALGKRGKSTFWVLSS